MKFSKPGGIEGSDEDEEREIGLFFRARGLKGLEFLVDGLWLDWHGEGVFCFFIGLSFRLGLMFRSMLSLMGFSDFGEGE